MQTSVGNDEEVGWTKGESVETPGRKRNISKRRDEGKKREGFAFTGSGALPMKSELVVEGGAHAKTGRCRCDRCSASIALQQCCRNSTGTGKVRMWGHRELGRW